ncbi:Late embryogenesis abundant protein, LEA-18 [Melia azedarach]|uniref:Late embryogenesis abundant protein, LEA-18 n=1 Tax=Melia azedarach TaxID=155640 RepID=A0ACC1XV16_MELAZ|nr:Late embryogenesis abundant protein, LEA-18 [Melia azedarach]
MEKKQEKQTDKKQAESGEEKGISLEGLPMEDSPYVKYKDLEDYKRKGYGTEGHLETKPGRGAGATDAPTLSGAAVSSEADISGATDVINRQGVP